MESLESMQYHNPYSGLYFFGFLLELLWRFLAFLQGQIGADNFVSDEIQILVLGVTGISGALVGSILVLRKMTMLANSLSHTILLGIVIAYVFTRDMAIESHHGPINFQAMLIASVGMGLATTFLTEVLTKIARLQEDASTGIVFTSLFSLGIILVTVLTRSAHIGTEVVMGNVDALNIGDCRLAFLILIMNVVLMGLFYKQYKITTFDGGLASALGIPTVFYNYLLMAQVSITVVGAFRAVGVLMILAFITGPALTARLLTNDLKKMLLIASFFGITASIIGVALSRHILSYYGIALSTAGIVVCVIAGQFMIAALLSPHQGLITRLLHRRRLQALTKPEA